MRALLFLLGLPLVACSDTGPETTMATDAATPAADASAALDAGATGPLDATAPLDAGVDAPSCPASGPYGTEVGAVAPDVVLYACDGTEVRLHELCEAPVAWIVEYAEWCPICRTFARDEVERLWQTYAPMGVQGYVVVSADDSHGAPTAELCAEVRDRYGFTIPVLYDPTGALQSGLDVSSNAVNLLFTEGMRIAWKGRYQDDEVEGQLRALLE
ncbi:MAG: hypothetical protein CMN30_25450 [Sandaracinus sp.]|nr:hypothetical protein [Sandaracinus sp.]|tara:strand:+ start:493 stop:1137 length:645 start_codon:yes stop_codon:yes gene_type:complete